VAPVLVGRLPNQAEVGDRLTQRDVGVRIAFAVHIADVHHARIVLLRLHGDVPVQEGAREAGGQSGGVLGLDRLLRGWEAGRNSPAAALPARGGDRPLLVRAGGWATSPSSVLSKNILYSDNIY